MSGGDPLLARAGLNLAQVLLLRTLPFVVYVVLARGRRAGAAWAWPLSWLALAAGLGMSDAEGLRALGLGLQCLAYYVVLGAGAWMLAARPGALEPSLLFVATFVAFMLVPAWLWPSMLGLPVLVIGADSTLSCYSFVVECKRSRARPPLADALFFLLVNPCLSYADRGQPLPADAPRTEGTARALASIVLMWIAQLWAALLLVPLLELLPSHGYAAVILGGFASFLGIYIHHTSLAGLQVSLMRMVGWHVPERYRAPLRATSPTDFWRRWNIYMGTWFRRYVFLPLASRLARVRPAYPVAAVRALTVLVTFAAIGLYHDLYAYAAHLSLLPQNLAFFLGVGLLTLLWSTARTLRLGPLSRASKPLNLVLSRLCMVHVMSVAAWALQH